MAENKVQWPDSLQRVPEARCGPKCHYSTADYGLKVPISNPSIRKRSPDANQAQKEGEDFDVRPIVNEISQAYESGRTVSD